MKQTLILLLTVINYSCKHKIEVCLNTLIYDNAHIEINKRYEEYYNYSSMYYPYNENSFTTYIEIEYYSWNQIDSIRINLNRGKVILLDTTLVSNNKFDSLQIAQVSVGSTLNVNPCYLEVWHTSNKNLPL